MVLVLNAVPHENPLPGLRPAPLAGGAGLSLGRKTLHEGQGFNHGAVQRELLVRQQSRLS
jgi:hypothetical protein